MASPTDTFKSSFFGQLKSYSTAVQGAFEQRIARPLLAFKRDLSRPTSETRTTQDHENVIETRRSRQESTSSSSPLEIIDADTTSSFRSIFDKVKNTLSPSTKRRTSENPTNDSSKSPSDQTSTPSVNSISKKTSQKTRFNRNKSVSFADNVDDENDNDSLCQYSLDERSQIIQNAQTLANQILIAGIDEAAIKYQTSDCLNSDDEFQRDFYETIKPRRITRENKEQLVYQDLSAEIVAYVLKHAIRTLKKEEEQQQQLKQLNFNEANDDKDDFIDLK